MSLIKAGRNNFSEIGSVSSLKEGSVVELVEGTNNCTQCDSCNWVKPTLTMLSVTPRLSVCLDVCHSYLCVIW